MQIKPQSGSQIRPEVTSTAPAAKVEKTGVAPAHVGPPAAAKSDAVRISDAGRALAARGDKDAGLTSERTAQIRQRVLDGGYNSLAVIDDVARRISGTGDLK
jgi:anti-sigma28 factor (negative regulator of flagellin synthesis)